jgi:sulfate transporter 3
MFKNYHIDGNKEMIAFGMMNIAGSFSSCYLTTVIYIYIYIYIYE